jgi:hypothetical protein
VVCQRKQQLTNAGKLIDRLMVGTIKRMIILVTKLVLNISRYLLKVSDQIFIIYYDVNTF